MFLLNASINKRYMIGILGCAILTIFGLLLFCPQVFAGGYVAGDGSAPDVMIGSVVRIITTLCTVIGIILGIVGLVKFIIAHANEQGPEQQKAVMWIAVAIILVIVPNVIGAVANNWIGLVNAPTE